MRGGGPAHAQLEAILACVSGGVAVADAGGRVLEANERWCEIVGQARGEIVGRPWDAALHSDGRGLTAVAESAPARPAEVRVVRPGGEVRWALVTLRAVSGEPATVVALEDITEAKRWDTERAALHRVAEAVGRGEEPEALLSLVAEEMAWLVNADGAGIVVFEGADHARVVGRWAIDPELIAATPDFLPLEGEGAAARVFATGRAHRTDYRRTTGGPGAPVPWQYSVAAPIRVEGRLWGALGAVSVEGTALSDDAEERIARFAELVGVAIANTEARELLVRQASTDPLTGLAHHGAFHEALADEARRAERYGHPLSLAVIDLDHFKAVNDAHGHSTGDNVLREVAGRLRDPRAVDRRHRPRRRRGVRLAHARDRRGRRGGGGGAPPGGDPASADRPGGAPHGLVRGRRARGGRRGRLGPLPPRGHGPLPRQAQRTRPDGGRGSPIAARGVACRACPRRGPIRPAPSGRCTKASPSWRRWCCHRSSGPSRHGRRPTRASPSR